MTKILVVIKEVWFFIWGILLFHVMYDRKYLKSKYFKSKNYGIGAVGWRWVINDFMARVFLGVNREVPFPISPYISVSNPKNIEFHVDDLNNFQGHGNYYQAIGESKIFIGKGSWIAPNVGIITTNHDINNLSSHIEGQSIKIGERCWIGMNSVLLPGVVLGANTIVGAGSIVTKSFPNGHCIIAGNPAKKIRDIK
ncbi:MAG: acyltransferase [Firmicutes bacterium]|nr:acyltransferase [Bacillota bacterium]